MACVLSLKLLLMGFFSSDYQNRLFIPFVEAFINGFPINPYELFYVNNMEQSFPYPPLMLFVMSVGGVLYNFFASAGLDSLFASNLIFKLPILAFDIAGLVLLLKLYPDRRKSIAVLYFASPIILYSSYMHGQLDIIPTTLAVAALYYLIGTHKRTLLYFVLFCAAAIMTKHHILMLVPLALIYIANKHSAARAVHALLGIVGVCLPVVFAFYGTGLLHNVFLNREMNLLTRIYFPYADAMVFLPILGLLSVYLNYYLCNSPNRQLFLSFCGVLFAVALIFVIPMPGWYVWIVPFITIFFVQTSSNRYKNLGIFLGLNFFYLLYFVFCHRSPYVDLYFLSVPLDVLKTGDSQYINLSFTLLEGFIIYATIIMYRLGISSNLFYKRKELPFAIGIAGDSGSGKTTLLQSIREILNEKRIVQIEGDGDHKWARGEKMWEQYTHLNPKANHLYRQALDIEKLRSGAAIRRVDYDHHTGTFTEKLRVSPKPYIVISGLHSLYLPSMRQQLDLKIYMDTSPQLRTFWKMQRDMHNRSYSPEKIVEQINKRLPDAARYIEPQKQYADLVVNYYDPDIPKEYGESYRVALHMQLTLSAGVHVEPLVTFLNKYGIKSTFDFTDNLEKQIIRIAPRKDKSAGIPFNRLAHRLIPHLDDITTGNIDADEDLDGILKIIILYIMSYKLRV
ncbi:MAG: uridine kinase [Deltaproteobacteria bacterium]|nr:uridine kinase [Deltaproteobacteria bacterium]